MFGITYARAMPCGRCGDRFGTAQEMASHKCRVDTSDEASRAFIDEQLAAVAERHAAMPACPECERPSETIEGTEFAVCREHGTFQVE